VLEAEESPHGGLAARPGANLKLMNLPFDAQCECSVGAALGFARGRVGDRGDGLGTYRRPSGSRAMLVARGHRPPLGEARARISLLLKL
jgi:hypothetical protein